MRRPPPDISRRRGAAPPTWSNRSPPCARPRLPRNTPAVAPATCLTNSLRLGQGPRPTPDFECWPPKIGTSYTRERRLRRVFAAAWLSSTIIATQALVVHVRWFGKVNPKRRGAMTDEKHDHEQDDE